MENRRFEALEAPPKRKNKKIHKVLFIDKIKCAARSGVRSIAGSAINRSLACVRFHDVRSVAGPCKFDRGRCVRSHKMRLIADNYLRIPTAQVS